MTEDLLVWQDGTLGRLKLNRPKALNAITFEMALGIREALEHWRDDDSVTAVVIEGEGDKAFCAGGDILQLYNFGRENPEVGVEFWRDEYRLIAMIARYPKPYISLMDGITLGGGVGIASHGSHRIVTERSMLAMPEASIGFLPDVGGSYILSRAPGFSGLYLGMTGGRMNAADAIFAGFADTFMPSSHIPSLLNMLKSGKSVGTCIKAHATAAADGQLELQQGEISDAFGQSSALGCAERLKEMSSNGSEWATRSLKLLTMNAPLSVASAFYSIREAADLSSLEECIALEFRFAARTFYGHDFFEGVRAIIVDKDRKPIWRPSKLEGVTDDMVASAFALLGDNEWTAA